MSKRSRHALLAACLISAFVAVTGSSHADAVRTAAYGYGAQAHQALDAYWQEPDGTARRRALVILHGGYWNGGDKADWASTAQWYVLHGLAVFSVNYRLSTEAPWPAARDDVIAAIDWIKAHAADFGVDPDGLAVLGSQAGGQLAVQAGTYGTGDARVRGVIGLSAIASPRRAYDEAQTVAASLERRKIRDQTVILANCTPALHETQCVQRYADMGVAAHAGAGDSPMLLIHSTGDAVPAAHGKDAKAALAATGVKDVTVQTVAGSGSGGRLLNPATRERILGWVNIHTRRRADHPRPVAPAEAATLRVTRLGSTHSTDDGDIVRTGGPHSVARRGTAAAPGRRAMADTRSSRVTAPAKTTRVRAARVKETRTYGSGPQQQLDAYYSKPEAGTQPALVLVHGGYWYEGDKSDWSRIPRWFADRGYAVFVINYRLNTEAAWPAQRTDVLTALAWVRQNAADFGVDPARVLMLGSSAGGHLATNVATYGTGSTYVKAVAALSPVTSPYRAYNDGQVPGAGDRERKLRDTALLLARCTPVKTDIPCWKIWTDLVGQNRASVGDAPVYTIHSKNEFVPPAHSSALCAKLNAKNVSCTNVVVAGSRHATSVFNIPGVQDDLLKWLQAHD